MISSDFVFYHLSASLIFTLITSRHLLFETDKINKRRDSNYIVNYCYCATMAFSSTCKSSTLIFFSFGILFFAILLKFVILPVAIEYTISKSMKLIEGYDIYNAWYNPPNITVSKFYFFHIENPDEIRKGGKPKVQEIGPFVHETRGVFTCSILASSVTILVSIVVILTSI